MNHKIRGSNPLGQSQREKSFELERKFDIDDLSRIEENNARRRGNFCWEIGQIYSRVRKWYLDKNWHSFLVRIFQNSLPKIKKYSFNIIFSLIELKKKKNSEELTAREVADSKFAFYMPPRGVLNNDLYDPVPLVVTSNDPQESLNLSGGHDFVSGSQ